MRTYRLMSLFCKPLACLLLVWFSAHSEAELIVSGFDSNQHNRFQNSPSFIGAPYDWSGIGRSGVGSGLWGTLISPSFMVTATHFAISGEVTFFANNDPNGVKELRNVVSSTSLKMDGQTNVSDLTLVRLNAPVTNVDFFPILANPNVGDELFVFGLSNDLTHGVQANVRVGKNNITEILPAFSHPALGSSVGDVFVYDYDPINGQGNNEARVQGGDSGGPSFVIVDGKPALVGVHWFTYTAGSGQPPGSGDTLVSSFIDEINAAITLAGSAESVTMITAVPEPSSFTLTVFFAWPLVWRRSRRT